MKIYVAVDLQNDFLHPEGTLFCPSRDLQPQIFEKYEARKDKIAQFLAHLLQTGDFDFFIATRDWHPENSRFFSKNPDFKNTWPAHCVKGTWGAQFYYKEIYDILLNYPQKTAVINKGVNGLKEDYSAVLANAGIFSYLYNLVHNNSSPSEIIVFGVATEYCVYATYQDIKAYFAPLKEKVQVVLQKEISIPFATEDIAV